MRQLLRNVFLLVLLLGIGALAWAIYAKLSVAAEEERARPEIPVAVAVTPIREGTIRDIRRLTGTLYSINRVTIAAKISGRVEALAVDLGDEVKRGDTIARLDDDELSQQVMRAQSDLAVAEARLDRTRSEAEQARKEYERIRELGERRVASESDLDAALLALRSREADIKVAEAEVSRAGAELRSAEIRLSYATIRAEWQEGSDIRVVSERYVDQGEVIQSNQEILNLLDLEKLKAVIYVTERDYPKISIGQRVRVVAEAFPGSEFEGTVSRISPAFRETSRQAEVEITIPNTGHTLKPGMFVRTEILLEEVPEATIIPLAALVEREGRPGVFLADRNASVARFVEIQKGIYEGQEIQVLSPPIAGEVVTLGQNLLNDGSAINVAESQSADDDSPPTDPAKTLVEATAP